MEQQPSASSPGTSLFEMEIDAVAQNRLNTFVRWGRFIAVTLLIIVVLVVIALAANYKSVIDRLGQFMSLDSTMINAVVVILAIIGILCLIWIFSLLRACSMIKQGLISQNSDRIADGFKALKTFFIIGIIFSALTILSTLINMIKS